MIDAGSGAAGIESGFPFYGQRVGILVFGSSIPRVKGDAGNAETFSFPVRYQVVEGGYRDLLEESDAMRGRLVAAGRELKACGVKAIVGDCGLMSMYQDSLGSYLGLPFAGSSLCQLPMIWQLIGRSGAIGVITGHSGLLRREHLLRSGWTDEMSLSIQGMEDEPHFDSIVIKGNVELDIRKMREDVLNAGEKLRSKTPDLRVVVLECSNLASYSSDLSRLLGAPVFDTVSAANVLAYAVNPPHYE